MGQYLMKQGALAAQIVAGEQHMDNVWDEEEKGDNSSSWKVFQSL